jgi:hypothetical protein
MKKAVAAFCFGVTAGKKAMAMSHDLLMWFDCSKKKGDDNFRHLFRWLCCNKMVAYAFFLVLLRRR